jgi:hypothetical protein
MSQVDKAREERSQEKHTRGRDKRGRDSKIQTEKTCTWKIRHAGPPWIRSASFNMLLSEAPWSQNSCHSACSAWASLKWVGGALVSSRSYSGRATVPSEAGRAARDDEASASCVECRGITQPSSRITSTPAAGLGAGAGQFSH